MCELRAVITCLVLLASATLPASASVIKIYAAVGKKGVTSYDLPTIKVSGIQRGKYGRIDSRTLTVWITAKGHTPDRARGDGKTIIEINGFEQEIGRPRDPKTYAIEFPYHDPMADDGHKPVSPIDICNAEVARRNGKERQQFIKKGGKVELLQAYSLSASSSWTIKPKKKGVFKNPDTYETWRDDMKTRAVVRCLPTDFAKTSKTSSTSSNSDAVRDALNKKEAKKENGRNPKRTKGTEPKRTSGSEPTRTNGTKAKRKISFRAEPTAIENIEGERCPTKLRLVGRVDVDQPFEGEAFFVGPQWFSTKFSINLSRDSGRNISSIYPLDWRSRKPKASNNFGSSPSSQTVTLRMKLSDSIDGDPIKTKRKNIIVSCE